MCRGYRHSIADLKAQQGVIAGSTPLLVGIDRVGDIEGLIDLIQAYGLRAIISGGSEACMLAQEVAAAGFRVVLAPASNLPGNFDNINARRRAANRPV